MEIATIKSIVAIYTNLVATNKIPEYQVNNSGLKKQTEFEVNKIYEQSIDEVETVLWNLFFATKDGSLSSNALLQPTKYVKNSDKRNVPNDITSAGSQIEDTLQF